MSTLTFLILFFCVYVFLGSANRLYVRLLLLYHEFEQFGSLHMCTPRKDFGRSGTRTRYPRTLKSTTQPMSYPGATNMSKIISNSIYNKKYYSICCSISCFIKHVEVGCVYIGPRDVFLFIYNNIIVTQGTTT